MKKPKNKKTLYIAGALAAVAVIVVVVVAATSSAFNFNNRRPGVTPPATPYTSSTQSSGAPSASAAADTVRAPDITGLDYAVASQIAAQAGLRLVRSEDQYSAAVPAGTVLSQSPEKNALVEKGSELSVVLSKGPLPTPTPSPTPAGFQITVTAGNGGSVSPSGVVTVKEGASQTFTITPFAGYELREIKIDGVSVDAAETYTFSDVDKNHTLYAVFQAVTSSPPPEQSPSAPPSQPPESLPVQSPAA